jgi:hypothetical protein
MNRGLANRLRAALATYQGNPNDPEAAAALIRIQARCLAYMQAVVETMQATRRPTDPAPPARH